MQSICTMPHPAHWCNSNMGLCKCKRMLLETMQMQAHAADDVSRPVVGLTKQCPNTTKDHIRTSNWQRCQAEPHLIIATTAISTATTAASASTIAAATTAQHLECNQNGTKNLLQAHLLWLQLHATLPATHQNQLPVLAVSCRPMHRLQLLASSCSVNKLCDQVNTWNRLPGMLKALVTQENAGDS